MALVAGLLAAGLGAVLHRLPVFSPGFTPSHLPTADRTGFAGQVTLVAAMGVFIQMERSGDGGRDRDRTCDPCRVNISILDSA